MNKMSLSAAARAELDAVAEALLWEGDDRAADAIYAALERREQHRGECVVLPFPTAASILPHIIQATIEKPCVDEPAPINREERPNV